MARGMRDDAPLVVQASCVMTAVLLCVLKFMLIWVFCISVLWPLHIVPWGAVFHLWILFLKRLCCVYCYMSILRVNFILGFLLVCTCRNSHILFIHAHRYLLCTFWTFDCFPLWHVLYSIRNLSGKKYVVVCLWTVCYWTGYTLFWAPSIAAVAF